MADLTIRGLSPELVREFVALCDRRGTSVEDVLIAYMEAVLGGTQSIMDLKLLSPRRAFADATSGEPPTSGDNHELIGDGLARIGAITKTQLETILDLQKQGDRRRFGEIAIDLAFVNDEAIKRYLESKG